jgi:hydrogenase maturation protease
MWLRACGRDPRGIPPFLSHAIIPKFRALIPNRRATLCRELKYDWPIEFSSLHSPLAVPTPSTPTLAPPHEDRRLPVLVLGLGDPRSGDEAAGGRVIARLNEQPPLEGVRWFDGGVGGATLLCELAGTRALIAIIAAQDEKPVGTLTRTHIREIDDLPNWPGAACDGLRELMAAAQLLGQLTPIELYTVSVVAERAGTRRLSPKVSVAIATAAMAIYGHAARLAALARRD